MYPDSTFAAAAFPDATLLEDAGREDPPALWRLATAADEEPVGDMLDIVRAYEPKSLERDPWTVKLGTGFQTIIWTCLPAAVALEKMGYAITASSAQDLAQDLYRSKRMPGPVFIECAVCTRFDRCGNHQQHGDGCHCLYRGDFFRSYFPDGSNLLLCTNHVRGHAHSPASTIKLDID